jgi:HSP20 family protein
MTLDVMRPKRALTRSPWSELARIEGEMENLFTPFARWWPFRGPAEREQAWMPALDMVDRKDELMLRADLPGLTEKDIEVSVTDGMLAIRGERKEEREEKEGEYYYAERTFGSFVRTVSLPAGVDADQVKATFKNGVLEVHLPKTKEAKGKKIEITAA